MWLKTLEQCRFFPLLHWVSHRDIKKEKYDFHMTSLRFHVIYSSSEKLLCPFTTQKNSTITLSMLNGHLNGSLKYFSDKILFPCLCPWTFWVCTGPQCEAIENERENIPKFQSDMPKQLNWIFFCVDKYLHILSQRSHRAIWAKEGQWKGSCDHLFCLLC